MTQKIGIIGVGVMGGSLLLALKEKKPDLSVFTISRGQEARDWAVENGATSSFSDLRELPSDLDIIFLSSPSHVLEQQAHELKTQSRAIISDMASAKGWIVPRLDSILGSSYLSCHPMCGSEKTGLEGARSDLYEQKTVILSPGLSATKKAQEVLKSFWEGLGCKIVVKPPEEHDQAVAWVSHMPHLVIPALLQAINRAEKDIGASILEVSGTGLRDLSRLAGSNPDLWKDIFQENRSAIKKALKSMQTEINSCINMLNVENPEEFSDGMKAYLEEAKDIRNNAKLESI